MKLLNMDELVSEARHLVIGGVEHVVHEMNVDNFILTNRAAEKLTGQESISTQIEMTIEMICRQVPTIEASVLRKCSLPHLNRIVSFVRGDDYAEPETEASPAEEGAAKK